MNEDDEAHTDPEPEDDPEDDPYKHYREMAERLDQCRTLAECKRRSRSAEV